MVCPTFLKTPAETFDAIFAAIDAAETKIFFQCYKVQDDILGQKLRQALTAKAAAGVKVRVIYDRDSYIQPEWWSSLEYAGGVVIRFHRAWFDHWAHEHTKCVIVDNTIICGGCNFQAAWLTGWYDYDIQLEGNIVVEAEARAHFNSSKYKERPEESSVYSAPMAYALSSSDQGAEHVDKHLAGLIDKASKHITLASWVFLPGKAIHKALLNAIKHNVKVTIIVALPKGFETAPGWGLGVQGAWKAQRHYLQGLKAAGANVVACTGKYWHGKALLVDDIIGVFGSYNFNVIEAYTRTSNLSIATKYQPLLREARAYHEGLIKLPDFEPLGKPGWADAVWHYGIRAAMFVLKYLTMLSKC